jgi:L-asparaginase
LSQVSLRLKVVLLTTFAGDDGSLLRYTTDHGAAGVVIEGIGAGNVNAEVFEIAEYVLKKGIAVVMATRVYHGGVFPIYGDQGGGATMERVEVILGGDPTVPKACILLMMALPQVKGDHGRLKMIHSASLPTSRTQPFRSRIEISSSSL